MILVENPFTAWYLGNLKIRMIKEELQVKRAKAQICSTTSTQKQISNTNHFFHVRICVPNSYMCASIKTSQAIYSFWNQSWIQLHTYLWKSTHGFMQRFWTIHSIMAGVLSAMRIFLLFFGKSYQEKEPRISFHFFWHFTHQFLTHIKSSWLPDLLCFDRFTSNFLTVFKAYWRFHNKIINRLLLLAVKSSLLFISWLLGLEISNQNQSFIL